MILMIKNNLDVTNLIQASSDIYIRMIECILLTVRVQNHAVVAVGIRAVVVVETRAVAVITTETNTESNTSFKN